jgi:TRAP-type C4-dicarboxylate transport system permease small subunit
MKNMEKIYQYFNYVKIVGLWISGISVIGMMFFICLDVFLHNVFKNSINGAFEIVQNYFMPLVVFPSLAYVYSSGVLPKMDMLLEKFNDRMKKIIIMTMVLIEIFILVLLTQYTWEYAISGLERNMAFPAAGVLYPLYPVLFFIPFAFGLIILENVFILIRNIVDKKPTFLFQTSEDDEGITST